MKTTTTNFIPCGGVDSSLTAPVTEANSILNCRWDNDLGAWRNDRGLAGWWEYPISVYNWNPTLDGDADRILQEEVKSLFIWKKAGTNSIYNFVEFDNKLYCIQGNKNNGTSFPTSFREGWTLITSWLPSKEDEAGTQFIPFGDKLLILNGRNVPIWFSNYGDWRAFSFITPTPEPAPVPIQPDYQQGQPLQTGTGAPYFNNSSVRGVGLSDGTTNYYYYAMAYATEDGAISPLSSRTSVVWRVKQVAEEENEYKYGVSVYLPPCPEGCSARYIYRTKNIKTPDKATSESFQLYFLKEINDAATNFFIDILPDQALIREAETFASSLISTEYLYGENWNGRMWLANKQKIIYSEAGIPEQFGAASFFDLGSTSGGDITALKSFYNSLIVFRENAINVIRIDANGSFSVSVITTNVGSVATNAITYVPKLGIVFLNEDGLWALSGTMDGGSSISIQKISKLISEELKTLNTSLLRRAIGAYSPAEKEFWLHYPSYYSNTPDRGIVIHTDRDKLSFSFRGAEHKVDDSLWLFSAMAIDANGRFVFAGKPEWTADPSTLGARSNLLGWLQVWCASTYHGQTITNVLADPLRYEINTIVPQQAYWESSWISFDQGGVRIFAVELDIIAQGDKDLFITYQADYSQEVNQTTAQKQTESKVLFTKEEPPVGVTFGAYNKVTKNPFIISESVVQGERKVRLRFDINTGLINQFRFKVTGISEPFALIGFRLAMNKESIPLLNQSINLQRGQSR